MAMSNVLNAFRLDFDLMQIIPSYSEIAFARGNHLQPIVNGLASTTPNSFELQWMDNSGGNPLLQSDNAQILYAADGESTSVFLQNVATRIDASFTVPLASSWSGKTVHVWLAFLAADNSAVSNSVYAGSVVIS